MSAILVSYAESRFLSPSDTFAEPLSSVLSFFSDAVSLSFEMESLTFDVIKSTPLLTFFTPL